MNDAPESIVTSSEPASVEEHDGYRVSTFQDVEVSIKVDGAGGYAPPSKPRVTLGNDRLDSKVEVVTNIQLLGFELWRYTHGEGDGKQTNAGSGSHRGTFEEVEIEENFHEGTVHEFSIYVKR